MALTVDWDAKVVYSDASITDLPVHHIALRDLEASEAGMLHDDICSWQSLDLGSGATLPQIDYINGYELSFVGPGPFVVRGNLKCVIRNTGVQVERQTSAAYITTAQGGTGPTAADIAAAVRADLAIELAQLTKVSKIHGVGVPLVVSPTSRVAGDLVQSITTVGDTTTVSAA